MAGDGGGGGKRGPPKTKEEIEVEELLRSAEDHVLLQTRIDTHTTSSSLDPDLARRLQALKSPPPPRPSPNPHRPSSSAPLPRRPPSSNPDEESLTILGDDLAARFAALKGPVGSSDKGVSLTVDIEKGHDEVDGESEEDEEDEDGSGEGVSKKEVEKVMQWAMDAVRLDPSKSDDEDDEFEACDDEGEGETENLQLGQEQETEEMRNKGDRVEDYLFRLESSRASSSVSLLYHALTHNISVWFCANDVRGVKFFPTFWYQNIDDQGGWAIASFMLGPNYYL